MTNDKPLFNASTWVPHTRCPACQSSRVLTYKSMPAEKDARVRFHKCKACKEMFKSVESVSKI